MDENVTSILTEEMDEETLSEMPLWFAILRENYLRKKRLCVTTANCKNL
jgi:hypothetical protein